MAGGIREDKTVFVRVKWAISDVDRDVLLALGSQPVGNERKIHLDLSAPGTGIPEGYQLVVKE
jgi:hypothetical protein